MRMFKIIAIGMFVLSSKMICDDECECIDSAISFVIRNTHNEALSIIRNMDERTFLSESLLSMTGDFTESFKLTNIIDSCCIRLNEMPYCQVFRKRFRFIEISLLDVLCQTDSIRKYLHRYLNNKPTGFEDDYPRIFEYYRKLDSTYEYNSKADTIRRIYIPKNIEETYRFIDVFLPGEEKTEFIRTSADEVDSKYHFGISMSIRNAWGLWRHSRLYYYFKELGINEPDNMTSIIMICWHNYLNNKSAHIKEIIRDYKEKYSLK